MEKERNEEKEGRGGDSRKVVAAMEKEKKTKTKTKKEEERGEKAAAESNMRAIKNQPTRRNSRPARRTGNLKRGLGKQTNQRQKKKRFIHRASRFSGLCYFFLVVIVLTCLLAWFWFF